MTAFEDLKKQWIKQSQPETPKNGAQQILEKIADIKKKQQMTNIILSITIMVLVAFFIYISAYRFQTVLIGLLLMIGALVVRIGLEIKSISTLRKMNTALDVDGFRQGIIQYYANRKRVHFIFTPLIILLYCIGFIMLLPSFKAGLSLGFYRYVLTSAIVVLVVLSTFIFKQIRKELAVLEELQH